MATPERGEGMPLDELRQLIELAREYGLAELEVRQGRTRIRIRREVGQPGGPGPAVLTPGAPARPLLTIEAPMVGTFYRAPAPDADPYVKEGDLIKEGQVLGIIEAMKLMNEIESRMPGRIAKILVENRQPVEYGQPLFLVEPLS